MVKKCNSDEENPGPGPKIEEKEKQNFGKKNSKVDVKTKVKTSEIMNGQVNLNLLKDVKPELKPRKTSLHPVTNIQLKEPVYTWSYGTTCTNLKREEESKNQNENFNFEQELENVKKNFDQIPLDKFMKGGRHKAIARFKIDEKSGKLIESLPHEPMWQGSAYNPVAGSESRPYPLAPKGLRQSKIIRDFIQDVMEKSDFDGEVIAHFQRTVCTENDIGYATGEGIHQDGQSIVSILCTQRTNIKGGVNYLLQSKNEKTCFFESILNEGDGILFSDPDMWHYVSPVEFDGDNDKCSIPNSKKSIGIRDVVIIVAPGMRPPRA